MLPVVALVGRPNVGKSTLFNCLTKTRDALVADQPGLTRDRNYGYGKVGPVPYIVVDTGGLTDRVDGVENEMASQALAAIEEADIIFFLVDARAGLLTGDHNIADQLRATGKPIYLVVNKIDGIEINLAQSDFFSLGFKDNFAIAASHRRGVRAMMDTVLPEPEEGDSTAPHDEGICISIVGRPNVGKSTLVNRILGEERVVVFDMPGTTRDSIRIPFERQGKKYTLIDTAGIRRKKNITEMVETFSIIKTLQAIDESQVTVLVLDAHAGVTEQDASLLGNIIDSGRAIVIAINKWDGISTEAREQIRSDLGRKLAFINYAKFHFISALHGSGVGELYQSVEKAYESALIDVSTSRLTRLLERAVEAHAPPVVRAHRIKLRYAHQGGKNPPIIVIHGNQTESVNDAYKRYLVNFFRKAIKVEGTPIRIEFKSSTNPYEGRKKKQLSVKKPEKRSRPSGIIKKKSDKKDIRDKKEELGKSKQQKRERKKKVIVDRQPAKKMRGNRPGKK